MKTKHRLVYIYFIFGFISILGCQNGYAQMAEEFIGNVEPTRIGPNPASTALITRNHVEYGGFAYQATNAYADSDVAHINDDRGNYTPYAFADSTGNGNQARFEETFVMQNHAALFGTLGFVVLGLGYQNRLESHQNGTFMTDALVPSEDIIKTNIKERIFSQETSSLYFGFSFGGVHFGTIYNQHKDQLTMDEIWLNEASNRGVSKSIGLASYTSQEFGLMIPTLFDFIDLGITHRPETKVNMKFDVEVSAYDSYNNTIWLEMTDYEYTKPAFTGFGASLLTGWGDNLGLGFSFDFGKYAKVDKSKFGEIGDAGHLEGKMVRLLWDWFDVKIGQKSESLYNYTFEKNFISFKIPVSNKHVIRIGGTQFKVTDNIDNTLLDVPYFTASVNVKFGSSASQGICGSVAPKTKTMSIIDKIRTADCQNQDVL